MRDLSSALVEAMPQVFGETPVSTAWWVRPAFFTLFLRVFCELNDLPPETIHGIDHMTVEDIDLRLRDRLPEYEEMLQRTVTVLIERTQDLP